MTHQQEHWQRIARRWASVKPPLRPAARDREIYQRLVDHSQPANALIFGVTPEVYGLSWPTGCRVRALDHTEAMIGALWAGPPTDAFLGEWTAIPSVLCEQDMAFCDGGLHLLDPASQGTLAREIGKILRPGGRMVFRFFCRAPGCTPAESVLHDPSLSGVSELKLRLGCALSDQDGVALKDIYAAILDYYGTLGDLATARGWPLEETLSISSYEGSALRYFYSDFETYVGRIESEGGLRFEKRLEASHPSCPIAVFERTET